MDVFYGQESLTAIQWVIRAVVAFFFLLIAAKIMGQRSISQLRLLDFVIALILGNIIAHPLSDEKLGLKGSMITMTVLVVLYTVGLILSLKWDKLKNWLDPTPFPIIKNGQIIYKSLVKARISIDYLLSELRKEKIEDIRKVSLALWESDGTISFFLHPQHQPLTPADMQVVTKPFDLPRTIIKDGKIHLTELRQSGKDETWLKNRVRNTFNADVKDILLATMDSNDNMKVFLYK